MRAQLLPAFDDVDHQVSDLVDEAVLPFLARLLQLAADLPAHAELVIPQQALVDGIGRLRGGVLLLCHDGLRGTPALGRPPFVGRGS